MRSWRNLPQNICQWRTQGEDTYRDGLAIANIRNLLSGNGHYVVMFFSDVRHRAGTSAR